MSLQNEPKAVQTWDSCVFTAAEEKLFLREYFYPALQRHGLTDVEIYLWDHNKERLYEWMRDIIDETTEDMVAGACFHWYSGDHFEQLELCRRRFPEKELILSESCIEYRFYDKEDKVGAAQALSHELIGDLNHGLTAFFDWNLLLDETGGPNYVGNFCLAPFHFHRQEKRLEATPIQRYYERFARAVVPGSIRVETTRFSDDIDATAWKRPDGSLSLLLLNRTDRVLRPVIRLEDREAALELAPYELASATM
jgi:glucosylceramidase